jgi:hypothetical protein
MLKKLEATRGVEHGSRSALVRDALQLYFTVSPAAPTYDPTPTEARAIARGEYLTLNVTRAGFACATSLDNTER